MTRNYVVAKKHRHHRRPSSAEIRDMQAEIRALPQPERTFERISAIALARDINWQTCWRYASFIGAPIRNSKRAGKRLSGDQIALASEQYLAGARMDRLACQLGCSEDMLRRRVRDFQQDQAFEPPAPSKVPFSGPRLYASAFLRPVTPEMLTGQRARTRPTLAESPPDAPKGP